MERWSEVFSYQNVIVGIALVSAGIVPAVVAQQSADEGERIYKTQCAVCHQEEGEQRAPLESTLNLYPPELIISSLESGVMKVQGSVLSPEQRHAVARYLSHQTGGVAGADETWCTAEVKAIDFSIPPTAGGWGFDHRNSRSLPAGQAQLKMEDVPRLKLKWARSFPGATRVRVQPVFAGGAMYIGSQMGTVYALDPQTGCTHWKYQAAAEVRGAINISEEDGRHMAYFLDYFTNVYAVDAATGELIWKTLASTHPYAHSTGTPALYDGRLYVPISGHEALSAPQVDFPCCSGRGSVIAYDAATGTKLWETATIQEEAKVQRITSAGTRLQGPSGAMIWSTPTIDPQRNRLYVGTGPNHSSPATATSNAIIAMDLDTGHIAWVQQTWKGDAWNPACWTGTFENCPLEDGPDVDFGAPPILAQLKDGREIILAGQKTGDVFAMDPDNGGEILWQTGVGRGGASGGIRWGMALAGDRLLVPNSDREHPIVYGPGRPGLYALDIHTGDYIWRMPAEDVCQGRQGCDPGLSAPPTVIPGVVMAGALDGHIRAYAIEDGRILWDFDTAREFETINGGRGQGGTIDSAGPVIAGGMLYLGSGYGMFQQMPGNVFLAFSVDGK